VPEKPFNIIQPNSEQVWACFQRCLAFEDPQARWERLQNLIAKQLHDEALKARDMPALPLEFQDHLFGQLYGFNGTDPTDIEYGTAAIVLNVVLALEDIDNFEQIAFDSWKITLNESRSKEIARLFPKTVEDDAIRELSKDLGLSEAQHLWLQHMRRAVPNWSLLFKSGPWSGDARVTFVCEQLSAFASQNLTAQGYLAARTAFREALRQNRHELPGSFLPEAMLLVEGETESILLPHFANLLGFDFSTMGVMLMSAGGARQVARKYFELRDVVTLPMVLCVDADAGEEIEVAKESLRDSDRLHIWKDGEIEDTLETQVLVQQLNAFLQSTGAPGTVSPSDFPAGHRRTVLLNRLWRARGLGNFDKIGFAEVIAANVKNREDVPPDVVHALTMLEAVCKSRRSTNKANA
jgi:hypothetical protein